MDRHYQGSQPRPAELKAYYAYPKTAVVQGIRNLKETRKYLVQRLVFKSAVNYFGSDDIQVDYYGQKQAGRHPTVLALPISGGVDFCVESFARVFANHGFNCAIVYNRDVEIEDTQSAQEVEAYFRQIVVDNRQVLDYLEQRPEVDAERLGCLGLSLGGIKAAMVAGVDPRIKAVVMGLAGGSLADISVSSAEEGLKDFMDELEAQDISREAIHEELTKTLKTDPLRLAPYIDARQALLFIALFDRSVPCATGNQLRTAMGKPETTYFFSGHYTGFLYLPYAHAKSLAFFKQQFAH